jgi:hypothetical protein
VQNQRRNTVNDATQTDGFLYGYLKQDGLINWNYFSAEVKM